VYSTFFFSNSVLEELQLFNKRPDFYYEIIRTRLSVAQNDMHPVFTESSMKENYERFHYNNSYTYKHKEKQKSNEKIYMKSLI
jgi:hypothetical protein